MSRMTNISPPITQNELSNVAPPWGRTFTNVLRHAPGRSIDAAARAHSANAFQSQRLPIEWKDPEYRRAAMEGTVENLIAWGVRINREEQGLTQTQLAAKMGTKQAAISKLEDPEGGDVLLSTLTKAAHALDVALLVRFVDYTEFAAQTRDVRPERLFAARYSDATAPMAKTVTNARKLPR